MVTLLLLVVLLLLIGGGDLSLFQFDFSVFPGGTAGLMALVVVALLVTRRI